MTKEELKQAIELLEKKRIEDRREKAKELLAIVQQTTKEKIVIVSVYNDLVVFNFNISGKIIFSLDFSISYNDYRGLEISHPLNGGRWEESQRKYVKERDRIIARLWDFEDSITIFFKELKDLDTKAINVINEFGWELDRIVAEEKNKAFNEAMAQVKVGRKFRVKWLKGTWEDKVFEITKITDKLIFTSNYSMSREKKSNFVDYINRGSIIWQDEQPKGE